MRPACHYEAYASGNCVACDAEALACRASCVGASDCAPGYECDDGAEEGGRAVRGPGGSSHGVAIAIGLALAAVARRRRAQAR